ncbi:hypothetical protein SBA3_1500004 [Candidatus Sulfopaludibacter sp. SbA3]|nr:hypothetical protein SBA3_1500004 [Candidatus Sulfopaludibacter sp. SbA3]
MKPKALLPPLMTNPTLDRITVEPDQCQRQTLAPVLLQVSWAGG